MRRALPADLPEVRQVLMAHAATSMFALSNLNRFGAAGGHPRAMRFWLGGEAGAVTDVLGVSEEGMVFPHLPSGDWDAAASVLRETGAKGLIGPAKAVHGLCMGCAWLVHPPLDHLEPHYHVSLDEVKMPQTQRCELVPLSAIPRPLAEGWRADFCAEALDFPPEAAAAKGREDVAAFVAGDTHRVLKIGGQPVAMTGFNAILPEIVQVGGVYVPPPLRRHGHARRAVALHLAEALAGGVTEAVLSAATPSAARAYEAIGFARIGDFAMKIWPDRQIPHG